MKLISVSFITYISAGCQDRRVDSGPEEVGDERAPPLETVDVLAADVYRDDWKQSHHDDLVRLGQGKPIVIGECAPPPTLETLAAQPRWAWYMPWGNLVFGGNGGERTKALLADPRVLTREDVTRGEDGAYRITR